MNTNLDSNTIHIHKIQRFILSKNRAYKEQIEKNLYHLSVVLGEYFPLRKYYYHIVNEYDGIVIVERIDKKDIDDSIDVINVNIISKK